VLHEEQAQAYVLRQALKRFHTLNRAQPGNPDPATAAAIAATAAADRATVAANAAIAAADRATAAANAIAMATNTATPAVQTPTTSLMRSDLVLARGGEWHVWPQPQPEVWARLEGDSSQI